MPVTVDEAILLEETVFEASVLAEIVPAENAFEVSGSEVNLVSALNCAIRGMKACWK